MRCVLFLSFALMGLSACSEAPEEAAEGTQEETPAKNPQQVYLETYAMREDAVVMDSGLIYRVITKGDGASPELGEIVRVHYRGTFIDGVEFDSSYSRGQPAEFPSDGVIRGWQQALVAMKEGDKWELVIPHELAYGPNGRGPIPGGATLVFEVELLKVLREEEG